MEGSENQLWRHLTPEERAEKLKAYFVAEFNHGATRKTISKETQELLINLVLGNNLRLKKELDYDRVNQRVGKIHGLVPEPHSHNYVYMPKTISKKDKSRKMARSMLFRNGKK